MMRHFTEDERRALHRAYFTGTDGKSWYSYDRLSDEDFEWLAHSLIGASVIIGVRLQVLFTTIASLIIRRKL